jgi:hypothetical protein
MTGVFATFLSARNTALSVLWFAVVLCSGFFLLAVLLGLLFRSRRCWGVAVALIVVDLALAASVALLDRLGFR